MRPEHLIAKNLLDRLSESTAPNQRWVAGFTYIWTAEGWLFLAAVIDLLSRRVIGWSMSSTMTAQLVIDVLLMALWRRGKPSALTHHSDQGGQYASEDFQRLLDDQGITCSMSKRGDCSDHAAMESFFSSLKFERIYRKKYVSREEVRADVFDYIEMLYDPGRRHSTLGQISTVAFENRYSALPKRP